MDNPIRIVRKELGLTQAEFGREVGKSRDTIANIESGRVAMDATLARLIASRYGYYEGWLLSGKGEPKPQTTVNDEVGQIITDALKGQPDETREYFHRLLDGLTGAEILLMGEVLRRYLARRDEERQTRDKQETNSPQE